MLFNSQIFLFIFLPIAYFVFWLLRTTKQRHIWLTLTGYIFYSAWNWKFCFLMLFSTLVSYSTGLLLLRDGWTEKQRKWIIAVPITIDLLLLGFFKYAMFLLGSLSNVLLSIGVHMPVPQGKIILPIGISFYTFHTISYVVDSYRRVISPTRNFWEFASYVSLFSQLVAGPIVRFRQIEADLENIGSVPRGRYLNLGWSYFVIGLCQKVLLADLIASVIDPALAQYTQLGTVTAWLCMLGYTYQIYFDFAGYSNMAVGLGYLFGLHIPQNFDSPYKADGPSDFWRRWHMSLSMCLRDYLYIPFGGNRGGEWRVCRNLMLTMLIGGLWHGASWVFVAWGAYHGVLLCLNRLYKTEWERLPHALRVTITFVLVLLGWVLFRATDFAMAAALFAKMFSPVASIALNSESAFLLLLLIAFGAAHFGKNTFEMNHEWGLKMGVVMLMALGICLVRIMTWNNSPYLYFQF